MLRLRELEIIQLFRQPGGAEFALFCTDVIRATCWAHGIPQSEVSTTSRTDAKDGGVDTRIGVAVTGDVSGYFESPSIWQFKAADEANVSPSDMRTEVNKPHARACIQQGQAYRIVICDHLTDEKKDSLEQALLESVREISPAAPAPKVLGVVQVATVANSYPALVMQYRPGSAGICILFERWAQNVTQVTATFLPPSTFETARTRISSHADFSRNVDDAVLVLYGQSGVGKTRTVYECFRNMPGARTMVVYSNDEDSIQQLATTLVNDESASLIIVADDCSVSARVRLSQNIAGAKNRIRCICISSSTEVPGGVAPELAVTKPSILELQRILEANFPAILPDRRRAYAELSEGFVRIAADMCCHYDDKISQAGHVGPIALKLEEYYRERLGTEQKMRSVEAIALMKRVRYKGESPDGTPTALPNYRP
jgi:hypothetical protein